MADETVPVDVNDDKVDAVSSTTGSEDDLINTKLVTRETVLVNRFKWLMYIAFPLAAAVTVTFFFVTDEERKWYQDEFEEFAEEVFETTQLNLAKLDQAVLAMSQSWTSHATHDSTASTGYASYPNTTLPNFAVISSNLAALGNVKGIAVAPLVSNSERESWEAYAVEHQGWITEDLTTMALTTSQNHEQGENCDEITEVQQGPGTIHTTISASTADAKSYVPVWQIFPTPIDAFNSPVMLDLQSLDWFPSVWKEVQESRGHVFSPIVDLGSILSYHNYDSKRDDNEEGSSDDYQKLTEGISSPQSVVLEPIFEDFDISSARMVGVAIAFIEWKDLFSGLLEDEAAGMILDLEYSCSNSELSTRYGFRTTANEDVIYSGTNIQHNQEYDYLAQREAVTGEHTTGPSDSDSDDRHILHDESGDEIEVCNYFVSIHATDEFIENWQRNDAMLYAILVCAIFIVTGLVFFVYDAMVQNRNRKVVISAERSKAIVTSLFPRKVAEQMMEESNLESSHRSASRSSTIQALKAINIPSDRQDFASNKKPIADLFKDATIMFADIAGFTAWSSMREPAQVFKLLETIFNAFDTIADRRNVFKVETVGDCYVAVCGLPDPRRDHALVMARFARDCLTETKKLTKRLELELGPDTSHLSMRFGLHSGPVTAGVLRGQRARFQLFGDTMNRASRIETSGQAGKIHISAETADLLVASGKGHWVSKREDIVNLKGIGHVSTFWLNIQADVTREGTQAVLETVSNTSSAESNEAAWEELSSGATYDIESNKIAKLVSWHTQVLSFFLRKLIALRNQQAGGNGAARVDEEALRNAETCAIFGRASPSSLILFPVVQERVNDPSSIVLDDVVMNQLGEFVREIAAAYNPNPFHNFQHASHVVMSVTKLLNHMEMSSDISIDDPMTQFAVVLTALVHDVDHPGVPNEQLVAEGHTLSKIYNSSIAERNSLDVAWGLLCQDSYHKLRRTIYRSPAEFEYFRQLMVHSVLVTDLMDKDLQNERKRRWNDAFLEAREARGAGSRGDNERDMINKQKMSLMEHVIQTSDVAHTMQHWNVYQKWNHCLYQELFQAYQCNRAKQSPSEFWYDGEIGFLDDYIIPLAQRLRDCPAFDASGQELLHYAKSNRAEWEVKGKQVIEQWR